MDERSHPRLSELINWIWENREFIVDVLCSHVRDLVNERRDQIRPSNLENIGYELDLLFYVRVVFQVHLQPHTVGSNKAELASLNFYCGFTVHWRSYQDGRIRIRYGISLHLYVVRQL